MPRQSSLSVETRPIVKLSPRGSGRLRNGHIWVYRSDIVSSDGVPPGAVVDVADERGKFLGTALYSSASQIAIRMVSTGKVEDLPGLVRKRIQAAIAYREQVVGETDAYRLIFSEADFLPGLIVDRYNDLLSFQVLTQAMDSEPQRQTILSELSDRLKPAAIVERVDPRVRELEQLPARASSLALGEKSNTVFSMNGVRFHFDALLGQKTGAFLDQRENYAAAQRYARGEALDVFCYQGGSPFPLPRKSLRSTGGIARHPLWKSRNGIPAWTDTRAKGLKSNASNY